MRFRVGGQLFDVTHAAEISALRLEYAPEGGDVVAASTEGFGRVTWRVDANGETGELPVGIYRVPG